MDRILSVRTYIAQPSEAFASLSVRAMGRQRMLLAQTSKRATLAGLAIDGCNGSCARIEYASERLIEGDDVMETPRHLPKSPFFSQFQRV